MILLWVNKEINELSKYKHFLGNILTICRVSMVVGRGRGCLCQCMFMIHVPLIKPALRACSHGGGGPQVGDPLVGLPISRYNLSFFSSLLSHERWGDSPRQVARSALPGNPLRGGKFSPCECWRWGGWCLAGHLSIIKPIERLTGTQRYAHV